MRLVDLFIFMLCMGFSVAAFAGREVEARSCGEVDLRPVLGAPLDQGDTGHCFAHASADLIAVATGHRVSPLDLATSYILGNFSQVQGTNDRELQDYLRDHHGFLETWRKDRGDEPQNFSPAKILTDEGIYWTGGEEMQTIFVANVFGLCDQEKLPAGEANYNQYLKDINVYHQMRLAKHAYQDWELRDPIGEVTEPQAKVAAHSFQNWVDGRCGRHWRPHRALLPENVRFAKNLQQFQFLTEQLHALDTEDTNSKLFRKVDEQLDLGHPVSIGYSANDIMHKSKAFPSGDHASVIAARKQVKGQCLYFVRNSFGDSSADYLKRFKETYEQGGVWVRAKDLKSIYSVVWIR